MQYESGNEDTGTVILFCLFACFGRYNNINDALVTTYLRLSTG